MAFSFRLVLNDRAKLQQLAYDTNLSAAEVLRRLIRVAHVTEETFVRDTVSL
jgi:hypothetical protein